jgi:membrane fusion protein (multidrug efflux system)
MAENPVTPSAASKASRNQRKRWLAIVIIGFLLIGAAYGVYWAIALRDLESTDDAYVNGHVVQITPQISGTVVSIGADDTQFVKAGQTLVELDPADARLALSQAEAQLARSVREVRSLFATSAQIQATVEARQTTLDRVSADLERRERLSSSGAVSGEELSHARGAVDTAKAALQEAQQQLAANRVRVDRTTVDDHPDVQNAAARVREAYLMLARTVLPAPSSGVVAKRAVQLGQRVAPGTPLMAIIPLDDVWVDANFKEAQLASMRVGQPVTLTADLYGSKVTYHGRVAGFSAGTGAAFSLLPAQNATGNWIKVVQRVPVRVTLDPRELAEHPLQVGLSMQAEVSTRDRQGARLPTVAQTAPAHATDVFDTAEAEANKRVKAIIAANDGGRATPPGSAVPPRAAVDNPTAAKAAVTARNRAL